MLGIQKGKEWPTSNSHWPPKSLGEKKKWTYCLKLIVGGWVGSGNERPLTNRQI